MERYEISIWSLTISTLV